jgi:hypothetical protein
MMLNPQTLREASFSLATKRHGQLPEHRHGEREVVVAGTGSTRPAGSGGALGPGRRHELGASLSNDCAIEDCMSSARSTASRASARSRSAAA